METFHMVSHLFFFWSITAWSNTEANFPSRRCKPGQPKPRFKVYLLRDARHRWFRSAVVKPCWEKRSRWGPWRVLLLHTCALLYSFNYSLWTQTDLFILRRSICWGLVGTENTHATHTLTHSLLFSCKSIYPGQHKLYQPAWVSHIHFMSINSAIYGYLSIEHHHKQTGLSACLRWCSENPLVLIFFQTEKHQFLELAEALFQNCSSFIQILPA